MDDDDKALVVTLKHGGHSVFTKSVDLIERQAARIAALEAEVVALNRVIAGQATEIVKLRQERADMDC